MNSKYYKVVARTKRYWFCKPFVVFDVVCCFQVWYDPYVDRTRVVAKCGTDRIKAVTISNQLNANKV